MTIGDRIDETGLLLRDGGGFQLRRDSGGRYELLLQRMPIDEVQKQVRVIGRYAGDDQIEVEGIQLVGRGAQPE
ncbi:DUF5818 domain-containing protein [Sphingomonas vulcanisoli]|uniref:DUF5818 domain-containing protein n=1 Tax=Sphingomonas vulcanisoli TaxID=1658060 RepID=UPI00141F7FBD|nr:DUF5818 domain-containing protein [Sphingomonas vulcanisoli]